MLLLGLKKIQLAVSTETWIQEEDARGGGHAIGQGKQGKMSQFWTLFIYVETISQERNLVIATNSSFLISIFLEPDGVNL